MKLLFAEKGKLLWGNVVSPSPFLSLDTKTSTKWEEKYSHSMKSWRENWDLVSPVFKFSEAVRKVIYTTNAIESLNSSYKRLSRQRSVFRT